jgi:hypothetical protein
MLLLAVMFRRDLPGSRLALEGEPSPLAEQPSIANRTIYCGVYQPPQDPADTMSSELRILRPNRRLRNTGGSVDRINTSIGG